ncbi:hypothetical protein GSI_07785 [Ganoderma sinense ZZ0214-1]|uniref:Uncharacterized protein n=1 Tax=Ganoderma sinense ZZ0214-1 TaxID=1077348 RepID=A0A2G8S8Y9_9APHY|nr:hypothetical protein GSI_07785 [Ganoderma sinense ZZ0214-1]
MSGLVATMRLVQQPATVVVEAKVAEAVEETIERTLSSPEFFAEVTADIRNLAQAVKDIRAGFRAVADDLVAFDNDEDKDKDSVVLRLRPQWLGYQAVYIRCHTGEEPPERTMIRQYTEAILTDVDPSKFEDVREELRGFLKKLDEKAPTAQQTQGDLEKLADDAKTHLRNVEKKFESISDEKAKLGIMAFSGLLLGGACAIVAMFVLVPNAGKQDAVKQIGVVGAGYCGVQGWLLHRQGTSKSSSLCTECGIEMKECRLDIANKKDRHRELLGHEAALTQTKERITALAEKLDTISAIWRVLKCDMQQLQEQLALVVDPDVQVTKRFLKKLRRPREVYNWLADLLELYANGKFELSFSLKTSFYTLVLPGLILSFLSNMHIACMPARTRRYRARRGTSTSHSFRGSTFDFEGTATSLALAFWPLLQNVFNTTTGFLTICDSLAGAGRDTRR